MSKILSVVLYGIYPNDVYWDIHYKGRIKTVTTDKLPKTAKDFLTDAKIRIIKNYVGHGNAVSYYHEEYWRIKLKG